MIKQKKLDEIKNRIKNHIANGAIKKIHETKYSNFFINNANDSLDSAKALLALSKDKEKQRIFGFSDFNGLLWVVNASYYSIFYMAKALLGYNKISIKADNSIHSLTFDAIVYYFYLNGKLQKELIKDFIEAKEEAAEILGKEKADKLIEDYFYEKNKRGTFTYEMSRSLIMSKAETSLKRAQNFRNEIMKIFNKTENLDL